VFDNLIESKAKSQKTFLQSAISLALHGLLIFGAIKATQGVAETVANRPVDTTMVFLKPPETPPPPPPPPPQDIVVAANPPPKGFQTVVAPDQIPTEIPPVDLNEKAFDPKDFTGKGVEGGIASGVAGGTGPVEVKGEVYLEAQLDDPVQVVSQPQPRYPPVMQSAGIAGRVEVQFVVDTTGHVEPSSFKILKSTHKAFAEPAREAILKSVFKPAKFKGSPVRQLVQQALSFKTGG
jgi:periplasmic protein TonB